MVDDINISASLTDYTIIPAINTYSVTESLNSYNIAISSKLVFGDTVVDGGSP